MAMFNWLKLKLRSRVPHSRIQLRLAEDAFQRGLLEQARKHALVALEVSPKDVRALSLLASIAADERRINEGLRWAEAAIAENPRCVEAHYAAGRLWDLSARPDRAEASYRQVIQFDPDHAKAHNNLGRIHSLRGQFAEAIACYQEALRIDPAQPEANQNYATLTGNADAREAAIQGYLRQTQTDPTDARAFASLANILSGSGRYMEALALVDRALSIDPERAEAHYARSLLLLALGDYAAGWKEYEWRWRLNNLFSDPAYRFPTPLWDGRRMEGGAILLHGELAFGDALQFVRYAPLVAERCEAVVFECSPQLKSLFERVEGIARVVVPGEALPPFDAHLALSDLPRIFGTTLQTIPWRGPYIAADRGRAADWSRLIGTEASARFKVGIVWSGNQLAANNRDRSVNLEILAPLQEMPAAAFFSLQKGNAGAPCPTAGSLRVIDHTTRLEDFSDTAAFISCLDLVITVDTSVAHLAGAMGMPVWVLLNRTADWRYHLERSDNPWYPSMRLYRQSSEGEWTEVIDRVAHDLRDAISRRMPGQGE
jgi:tetratricopeptide (TPR) repeat protein